jgi:hypothetical protein
VPAADPEERCEQLTAAPKADPGDAAPRVEVTEADEEVTRIDVADSAAVRPGKPGPRRGE